MVMLLNSYLTFKRFFAVFLVAVCLVFCFCGCKKEKVYLPIRTECYDGETLLQTTVNTFNENGFLTSETTYYISANSSEEITEYTYNKKGDLVSALQTLSGVKTEYTAEKVTEYKYYLTSKNGDKITVIFDGKGHIVYKNVENVYTLEQLYTYNNGKPAALKTQVISPSGNSKITDYIITFTSSTTYEYFAADNSGYRYVVTCEILNK